MDAAWSERKGPKTYIPERLRLRDIWHVLESTRSVAAPCWLSVSAERKMSTWQVHPGESYRAFRLTHFILGVIPPGNTCFAGLSSFLGTWDALTGECRRESSIFCDSRAWVLICAWFHILRWSRVKSLMVW